MNLIMLSGRLTATPEVRQANSGTSVAHFSIAVDGYDNSKKEKATDFFNCVTFGKRAEFCDKYLDKGSKVLLTGQLKNNNYTDKDGVKQYRTQIIVNEIEFGESKKAANVSNNNEEEFVEIPDTEELPFN